MAALDLEYVVDSVVNIIRARALHYRQLESLLKDVIYKSSVRWFSLGKVVKSVWELQNESSYFWTIRMYLVILLQKWNEVWSWCIWEIECNICTWYLEPCKIIPEKIDLFSRQVDEGNFGNFSLLKNQKVPESVSGNINDHLQSLEVDVTRRSQNFKKIEPKFLSHQCLYPYCTWGASAGTYWYAVRSHCERNFNSVTLVNFTSLKNFHVWRNLLEKCSLYLSLHIFVNKDFLVWRS